MLLNEGKSKMFATHFEYACGCYTPPTVESKTTHNNQEKNAC